MNNKIFLSVVMVVRNDNYGGNFIERLNFSLNSLTNFLNSQKFYSEIILIEWNPPKNEPKIKYILKRYHVNRCSTRIITVSKSIHESQTNYENKLVLEFVAKNVGIRRAKGEYILCTNPDIIFSQNLLSKLDPKLLKTNCFYRAIRYDVKTPNYLKINKNNIINYCKSHVIDILDENHTQHKVLVRRLWFIVKPYRFFLKTISWINFFPYKIPFTKAAGDFMLMHKNNWNKIRGYPEIRGWYQIDGLPVFQATFKGLNQVIFRYPNIIFHLDHFRKKYNNNMISTEVADAYKKMVFNKKAIIFNDVNWGLGETRFMDYNF